MDQQRSMRGAAADSPVRALAAATAVLPASAAAGTPLEAASDPHAAALDPAIGEMRSLIERGDYARALGVAEALRAESPQSRDVLYGVAVCERRLNRVADALATLGRLEQLHPRFTRLFQERGQCYVAQRAAAPAIAAFEQAVRLCPALPASWHALRTLYQMVGRTDDSRNAAAHVAKLASLPREVVTASVLFADGDVHEAERIIRQFLLTHGDHIEAMRLLARIGMDLDVLDDAELLLKSVLGLAPDYGAARYDYAIVLLRRHKHRLAQQQIDQLLKAEPDNRLYQTTNAAIAMGVGRYQQAFELYSALLRGSADDPELHLSVAHALKTLGKTGAAIDAYRAAATLKPNYGEAYWSLANLKTYRFTDVELTRMRAEESDPAVSLPDQYHLCFALAKAHEDRGEYDRSFAYYERGNELKRRERHYDPQVIETNARLQSLVCTRDFFARRSGVGCPSRAPIFVVGLPRSGSTLLEQILASHSTVEGTTELSAIPRLAQDLQGRDPESGPPRYPGVLAELTPDDLRRLGDSYLEEASAYRTGDRAHFVDKNPNNFRHLGLIRLILPNAKVIDARRGAMACCFSNYKQLFAVGQRFTYGLDDIARYYRSYVDLMSHWETVLPGWVLRVQHEAVVNDLEGSVRRILEFCGLDFEPACLEFYRTERGVNTPSSEQVRQPINREGLDQWQHFEPWLGPLRAALGPLADA